MLNRAILSHLLFVPKSRHYLPWRSSETVNFLRPLARRLASTRRPFLVAMRSRKPCLFTRRRLWGWNVLFIVLFFYLLLIFLSKKWGILTFRAAKLHKSFQLRKKYLNFSEIFFVFPLFLLFFTRLFVLSLRKIKRKIAIFFVFRSLIRTFAHEITNSR